MPPCGGFGIESGAPNSSTKHSLKANSNVGSVTNFHPILLNVLANDVDVYVDNISNRYRDPGAGAFSYHRGQKWFVTRNVEAGEELFNDCWENCFFRRAAW
uniref:SET domain-containing protein n=1 Tax=Odontella aurita TaxID=265563 RepID=A0A7S4M6E1_9STRA